MNALGTINRNAFNYMLDAYCNHTGFVYSVKLDPLGVYRYEFENRIIQVKRVEHISTGSFEQDNLYALFKHVTEELDKICREHSRNEIYISTSNPYKRYPLYAETKISIAKQTRAFKEYCVEDVNQTMRMSKFFDPDKTPEIKDVIFNYPATIVLWVDGTKTVVKAQDDDVYDPEKGLAMAICKKIGGNKWPYYNKFKHWLKKVKPEQGDFEEVSHITKVIKEG